MGSADWITLAAVGAGVLAGGFLLWRAARLATLEPECEALAVASGAVREARLVRRFYSARWLELRVGATPLRVEPGPAVRPVYRAVRREPVLEAHYCPRADGGRARLWEAHQAGRPVVSVASQRADARAGARVALVSGFLCLASAGLAGSALWARRIGR